MNIETADLHFSKQRYRVGLCNCDELVLMLGRELIFMYFFGKFLVSRNQALFRDVL
jgi:hypothetical protein